MKLEFNQKKSDSNKQKHGVNFTEAQALWNDPDLLEIPVRTADEPRCVVVGKIDGKHWSGIITRRDEHIRIISVRRSRKKEVELYES